ncbi:CHAT domain-containing protein [Pyrenophora tritici-repentis]|nr:CHAT domain-containing protein [Pyrenophora tritici-repentis]KAI1680785.1 CHAT domain containing protein [Pyrenophora tritici-repentis]
MDSDPFVLDVRLNGTDFVTGLVDSGCLCYSAINEQLFRSLRLPSIKIAPRQLEEAAGKNAEPSTVLDTVTYASIDIDGHQQKRVFFYVVPGLTYDVILGKPWLEDADVTISAKQGCLDIGASNIRAWNHKKASYKPPLMKATQVMASAFMAESKHLQSVQIQSLSSEEIDFTEEIRMFEDQDMQNLWHRSRQEDELYQELTTLVANKERNLPTKLQKEKSSGLVFRKQDGAGSLIQDTMTVQNVSELKLEHARLAYLSACSTAENRAVRLKDEVIHVVSRFQVAGFAHVVGCQWPSADAICVEVAKAFYGTLFGGDGKMEDNDIASALQKAVSTIREKEWDQPLKWAQFVHYGA